MILKSLIQSHVHRFHSKFKAMSYVSGKKNLEECFELSFDLKSGGLRRR